MPEYTPRLNLPKPLGNEIHNRANHNHLVDAIDANAASRSEVQAAHLALKRGFLSGQATLQGSVPADGYFVTGEPFVTISFPQDEPQPNTDYAVLLVPIAASDWGRIGELIVYDRAQNGFKVKMTGSAESVTFVWAVVNPAAVLEEASA